MVIAPTTFGSFPFPAGHVADEIICGSRHEGRKGQRRRHCRIGEDAGQTDAATAFTLRSRNDTISSDGMSVRLLEGLDNIEVTLTHADKIAAFESSRPTWRPVIA